MQSPETEVESTDSVPGNKNRPAYNIQWPVDSVTTSTIHECQLNAGTLSDEDRQLFRKATAVVAMETHDTIKDNMEIQILTDSHQYFVTSGDGSNKIFVFRDDKNQVKCRTSYHGASDDSNVIKIFTGSSSVSSHHIHQYQVRDQEITDEELALFRLATTITPPRAMAYLLQNISVTILAETRQFEFIPNKTDGNIIVQRKFDGSIVCGIFGAPSQYQKAWDNFIGSSWRDA